MQKLSKNDIARIAEIEAKLDDAYDRMRAGFATLEQAVEAYNVRVLNYNETLEEARGFASDIGNEIDSFITEKSEKWIEGEKGQAYEAWRDAWNDWQPEDVERIDISADEPGEECEPLGELRDLPQEPEA